MTVGGAVRLPTAGTRGQYVRYLEQRFKRSRRACQTVVCSTDGKHASSSGCLCERRTARLVNELLSPSNIGLRQRRHRGRAIGAVCKLTVGVNVLGGRCSDYSPTRERVGVTGVSTFVGGQKDVGGSVDHRGLRRLRTALGRV